jgi:hypothetical protein
MQLFPRVLYNQLMLISSPPSKLPGHAASYALPSSSTHALGGHAAFYAVCPASCCSYEWTGGPNSTGRRPSPLAKHKSASTPGQTQMILECHAHSVLQCSAHIMPQLMLRASLAHGLRLLAPAAPAALPHPPQ